MQLRYVILFGLLPVPAQALEVALQRPLMDAGKAAQAQCDRGNDKACQRAVELRRRLDELFEAEHQCRAGVTRACKLLRDARPPGGWSPR